MNFWTRYICHKFLWQIHHTIHHYIHHHFIICFLIMILMILFSLLTGLRLPTGGQTASRLTSAMACLGLLLWSVPICVHVPASTLYWRTWRQKQDITQSVKEFHTIPHLCCFSPHRSHRWQPLAGSSEQLYNYSSLWEKFTLHWTTLLKGSYIIAFAQKSS